MNIRKSITSSLLLAIGLVLHAIIPGFFAGVKPDFMLVFIVLAIMINPTKYNAFLVSLMGGFLTAITTNMPGGQIANVVDKLITCLAIYFIIKLLKDKIQTLFGAMVLGGVATIISGTIFLFTLLITTGLPMAFTVMFYSIVVPTALVNIPLSGVVYYAYRRSILRTLA